MTASKTTTLPERLARLHFNASLACMSGDDMDVLDAAATLEAASDLLGDAIALARWVAVLGPMPWAESLPPGLLDFASSVVRRADEAGRDAAEGQVPR